MVLNSIIMEEEVTHQSTTARGQPKKGKAQPRTDIDDEIIITKPINV
jgi:hypothetical protein